MHLTIVSLLCVCLTAVFGAPTRQSLQNRQVNATTGGTTLFVPPANYTQPGTLYAHTALLSDGTILATWENYTPDMNNVYFPIYSSKDNGATWSQIGQVTDTQNGWGMRFEPFLLELDSDIGGLTKGTIICVGNSLPPNIGGTKIDMYASTDGGATWTFVSHIASGDAHGMGPGLANSNVWEPYVMTYNGQLVVYYSDQRDPAHYQTISHQTSSDGVTWSPVVEDVAPADQNLGPGMATLVKMPDNNWLMAYEVRGISYAIFYRIGPDPLSMSSAPEHQLLPQDGSQPGSSPQVVWSAAGGSDGTVVIGSYSQGSVFLNTNLGDPGSWTTLPTTQPNAYSRSMLTMPNGKDVLICGGGHLPPDGFQLGSNIPQTNGNSVTAGVVTIPGY